MSYPISYKTDLGTMAVSNAERPLCALMAALVAARKDQVVKEAGVQIRFARIAELIAAENIPNSRMWTWYNGLRGSKLRPNLVGPIDGKELSKYQQQTVGQISVAGGVLNLGCGLGKTLTAVAAAMSARMMNQADPSRCWIVCPLNAIAAWKPYVADLKMIFQDVQIISMDSLHKVTGCANAGGVIIFDECHLLGEPTARRTKAAHAIRPMFDFGLCLTGTLLHGGVYKALSVLDLAIPGAAVFSTKWKAGEYFKILVKKKVGNRTFTELARPAGESKERFMLYLSAYTVAMTKDSDAVKSDITIPEQVLHTIEIGDCDRDLTELAVEYIEREMAKPEREGQIPHAMEVAQALCAQGAPEKLAWLFDQLDDEPVVVFAQYTETLDAAEQALAAEGRSYVRVDGSVTGKQRQEALARFQSGEVQIFLGQITAAGISADLQRSFVSVALDHNWRAADYAQALARTCRRGQNFVCHHFDLVTNKLQKKVVERLRAATDFDASTAEYQALKAARPHTPETHHA